MKVDLPSFGSLGEEGRGRKRVGLGERGASIFLYLCI